jgi:hypothetical protein
MFGTWISQIQADLRKEFPASRDYRPADFKHEPMPVSVGHFLEHALVRRAATAQVSLDRDWFDVADPKLLEAEKKWREALNGAAHYPASLWYRSLDQAVAHVVAFMVSPAASFCDFAFAGSEGAVSGRTILNRLGYFSPYSALREVVRGYVERKGSEPLTREDLHAVMAKADHSIVEEYEPSQWIALTRPLYDLASVTTVDREVPEVPTDVLKPVFEAKGAAELVQRIEVIESIGGHRKLSESALLTALGPTEPEVAPEEPVVAAEPATPEETGPVKRNDVHAQPAEKVVPRWMQFASKVQPDPESNSGDGGPASSQPETIQTVAQPNPTNGTPEAETPETATFDIPMPTRVGQRALLPDDVQPAPPNNTPSTNSTTVATADPETEPDSSVDPVEERVLGTMNLVQRAWFVNSLFDGDSTSFERVVRMLDKAEDWESASHVIGAEVFERHGVDIYSQAAVEFTNLIESRFQ